ncbi:glycoside hydrolase family 27 protein [Guyanagaster necrorhizus]|uniref:Alpha-galactosidase n=1 Tax=Guyanagaster necrorhizus TaxID=856835 RepID=A0A9P8AR31_9AGAR|nr:glycoside hydrolase family 27 protein [Guyanagaster necrorhizus MCA 3950]KAG7444754.1 glycoside hydrolase family 27 protein [Guyanagaster necrorhizus MCA 3950]
MTKSPRPFTMSTRLFSASERGVLASPIVVLSAVCFFFSLISESLPVFALENGVGRLPFMGYNTWNAYYCNIDEDTIYETAELIVSLGLKEVGYEYMNIDDCYAEKQRNSDGDIVENAQRFPSGMRNLTNRIHSLGLKTGIYGDSGWYTCQMYPGSYQNEERDVRLFRETWGFDLLKYDNCAVPFDDVIREGMIGKFSRMANAITDLASTTGRPPMLYSICQWGRLQPWLWARNLGHSWRTTDDISARWSSIASIINQNSFHAWASDFYGHNDMDILEVGNKGLSYEESKTHFTVWALMKSPLLIGTNLKSISNQTLDILKNEEIIAINQDPIVGTGIIPFRWGYNPDYTNDPRYPAQYWSGLSQNGTVFMLINVHEEATDMTFRLTESPWMRAGSQYLVRDLWTHTDNGTAVREFTAHSVPAHGVVALLLRDAGDEPENLWPKCAFYEWWSDNWCIDRNGTKVSSLSMPSTFNSNLMAVTFVFSAVNVFEYPLRRLILLILRRDYF